MSVNGWIRKALNREAGLTVFSCFQASGNVCVYDNEPDF